jgi:hypothetical protein
MQSWADYLEALKLDDNVLPLNGKA